MFKPVLAVALALVAFHVQAAAVFKCVDEKGKVTFTQHNCPDNHVLDDVVSARNQAPSGTSAPTRMAEPLRQSSTQQYRPALNDVRQPARQVKRDSSVTVVGGSADRIPCQTGLSERDLRTAKVRGEAVPGMSRKDVEGMYGKPNTDGHAQGAGGSTYWRDRYVKVTHVNYDKDGCVRSSYQSGDGRR